MKERNLIEKIQGAIKEPGPVIVRMMRSSCRWMSDKTFIKIEHRLLLGERLNLTKPETFNQKLQWLKFYNNDPVYTKLADKYLVREYVQNKIGEKYLIPLWGVYNTADEINLDALPDKFVLKATHGSGWNVICHDKSKLDWPAEKANLNRWVKKNYYWHDRERPYKNIAPAIICEQFVKTEDNSIPKDYKFFCFDGVPKFFFIASDRGSDIKFDFFDMDWNRLPVEQVHYPNSNYKFLPPKKWDEMVDCARRLAEGFPHVRVDFYIDSDDNIFFGELTFCHSGAVAVFEPKQYDRFFGDFLILPNTDGISL